MVTVKEKIRLIEACFGNAKMTADSKNAVVFCPVCRDNGKEKKKLAIAIDTGVYHCWVCEVKGRNAGRLALKCAKQKKAASELYMYYKKDKDEQLPTEQRSNATLPEDFRLVATSRDSSATSARAYLTSRGFTEKDIWRFRAGVSDKFQLRNRVIFPSFDIEQKINYYIARTFDAKNKLRYRNPNVTRKNVIFNEFDLDFSKTLVLTEGVFDLLHTPENSTCMLGSWLNPTYRLFKQIVSNKTPVILCLDPDAIDKTQKIAKSLFEYCIDVKISTHTKNDFGNMKKDEVNYYIQTAKRYDNVNRVTYLINEIRSGSIF